MSRSLAVVAAAAALVAAVGVSGAAQGAVTKSPAVGRAGGGTAISALADTAAVRKPAAPFLEAVVPEGLSALASWTPGRRVDRVTGYTLTAAVAKGYNGPVRRGCAAPPATKVPASDSSALALGLCARVPYTVRVAASNAAGTSGPSNRSNPVVPLAPRPPSAPLLGTVTARERSLVVTWSPPALTGGDPLAGYTLRATAGSQIVTTHPGRSATQAVISGLTDGTTYSVSLTANSKAGASPAVKASGTPSPPYRPGKPESLQVVPSGSGGLAASWQPPADDGGDVITGYAITFQREVPAGGGTWVPVGKPSSLAVRASARTWIITKVGAEKFYSVSIAAVSAAGKGQPATTSAPVSPTTSLTPGAVMMTRATMRALASDVAGRLTWPAPAPTQVRALTAGNVVVGPAVSAAPDGLLAKVVAVTRDGSGGYVVLTTMARLTDAFANLAVAESGQPAQLQSPSFTPALAGARILPTPSFTLQHTVTFSLNLQGGPNNRDSVNFALAVTPELSFDVELSHGLAGIPDGISVAASASVTAQVNVIASLSCKLPSCAGEKWQIGTLRFPPIPIGPLEITPTIPLSITASGTISVGVSASLTIGAGMSWTSSDPGTLNTQNLSHWPSLVGSPLPGVPASASADVTLKAPVDLLIDGEAGPDIEVDAGLKATVNFNPQPGMPWFQIGPFVKCKIGFDFNFSIGPLSYDNGIDITLATVNFPLYTIGAPPSADLTVSPPDPTVTAGKTLRFSAMRSDQESFAVSWLLQGAEAGDSITASGLLKVAAPAGRALTVVAFDSQGAQGQTQVEVGGESDPPADVRATLGADAKSATVNWTPPRHTGGYRLASYTVVTVPATTTITVPATTTRVRLTGLTLGTLYQVSVYATNEGGLTSAPGVAELATPLPGSLTGITVQRAPLPANAARNPRVSLNALACTAPGSCVAVGRYTTKANLNEGLIETETNGSWKPQQAPLPRNAWAGDTDVAGLAAVACPVLRSCVATGYYRSKSNDQYLIERLSGTTWIPSAAPQPPNATAHLTSAPAEGATQYIACTAASSCVDISYYTDSRLTSHILIETLSGRTWKATDVRLPNPAPGMPEPAPTIAGLACPSPAICVAVGTYLDKSNNDQGVTIRRSGGKWITANAPVPADASTTPSPSFASVSCGSPTFCAAVGTYEVTGTVQGTGSNGLIEKLSHGVWAGAEAPLPPDAQSPQYAVLNAVSCPAAGVCVGAGTYASLNPGSVQPPLIERLANGHWVPGEESMPPNDEGLWGEVNQLSCTRIGCMVLGTYGAIKDIQELFIQSLSAGPPAEAPLPADAGATPLPTPSPGGMACPTGGPCTAIGTYTDAHDFTQGLIETIGIAQP